MLNKSRKKKDIIFFKTNKDSISLNQKNPMTTIKFDLIKSLIKHLDPHLSIVLLEHYEAQEHKVFHPDVLQREKLLVLVRTKIIDYIQQECDKINDPVTQKIKSGPFFSLLNTTKFFFSSSSFLIFYSSFALHAFFLLFP